MNQDSFYNIKDQTWLENQRIAGKILNKCITECSKLIIPGKSTIEIDQFCETFIKDHGGIPAFKGYKDFPASICVSINKEIVHGIPSKNKIIQNGDIVKIDSGVNYKKAIADKARTIIAGECIDIKHKLLIEYVEKAFKAAVNSFQFKKNYYNRVGNIGYAIMKEAKKINAKVVEELGGHGLEENKLHGYPFIPNNNKKDAGPILYPNTTIAIEPILTFGSNNITLSSDKWTFLLNDIGVHWEDTIFIHEQNIEQIT